MTDAHSIVVIGAGPGLGTEIARRFGREGYRVGVIARRDSTLDAVLAELSADEIEARGSRGDASDRDSLQAALDDLRGAHGVPDVLVFNVALTAEGRPSEITSSDLIPILTTGVGGLANSVHHMLPHLRERRSGTILVTGSQVVFDPWVEAAALGVAKAGQRNFVHALHREMLDENVHAAAVTICGVIEPGTAFDPALIAEEFWRIHRQPQAEWEWEYLYSPLDNEDDAGPQMPL